MTDRLPETKCQTCRHWTLDVTMADGSRFGRCSAPLPIAYGHLSRGCKWDDLPTISGDVDCCPCWSKPKGTP